MATEPILPGDKSIAHRALLLSAMASGRSRIRGLPASADVRSTLDALRRLGVRIERREGEGEGEVTVHASGSGGWQSPAGAIDCGNSGTTARLLTGALASSGAVATLDGDASLRARPMRRVTEPLRAAGAVIRELGEPDRLPHRVTGGALSSIRHRSGVASAQVKSALLLAGAGAGVPVEVSEPERSRDHTERMLQAMGMEVRGAAGAEGWTVRAEPARLAALDVTVPRDVSAAAFLLAYALLGGAPVRLEGVGVNPTRTGFLDVAAAMGGVVEVEPDADASGGEPTATLAAAPASLRAVEAGPAGNARLIDEIPILAVLAARAEGESRLRGLGELRVKESDRLSALAANLRVVGVQAEEQGDDLVVRGTDRPLQGRVRAFGDHRIAMAFAVLGALDGNRIEVDDMSVCDVSFPGFERALRAVAAGARR